MTINKKEKVTYEEIAQAASALLAEGIDPSVRLIRDRTGGSNSTILEHYRSWKTNQLLASTVDESIPDALRHALLSEFGRIAKAAREQLEAQLRQTEKQLEEASKLLAESEERITDTEEQRKSENQAAAEKILSFEKALSAKEAQLTASNNGWKN